MFLLKKVVGLLLMPLSVCLGLLVGGLVLAWLCRGRWRTVGRGLITGGVVLLLVSSFGPFSGCLLRPLEHRYPPLLDSAAAGMADVTWVVVLGAGHVSDPSMPATTQLCPSGLARVVEGVRLYRQVPGRKLVVSGGTVFDPQSGAKVMARAAAELGVPETDIVREDVSRDTEEEARELAAILDTDRFFLVTEASHMPRSMAICRKQGLNPIAAPAHFRIKDAGEGLRGPLAPDPRALHGAHRAVYEILGLLWAWLRGRA